MDGKNSADLPVRQIIERTDAHFAKLFPELKGRRLSRSPEDEKARQMWTDLYVRYSLEVARGIRDRDEVERFASGA